MIDADDRRVRGGDPDPGDDVRVVTMRRTHLRAVARIEEEVNPRPWSLQLFRSELRHADSRIYVVAEAVGGAGSEPVGYAGMMLVGEDAHVTNVGVRAGHRRRRIATRMLLELSRRALDEGVAAFTLEVRMSNTAAQALYSEFGFVPAGIRKNYYADAGEDAMIMWATEVDTDDYRERLRRIEDGLRLDGTGRS